MLKKHPPQSSLIFVGGIYGSGKSTLCSKLAVLLNAVHLKASHLARHHVRGEADEGKAVDDVPENQKVLLGNLVEHTSLGGHFLLDGHFCIYNRQLEIEEIAIGVFQSIAPTALLLIDIEPELALHRLEDRERVSFNLTRLRLLRSRETEYAQTLSKTLDIPLTIVRFDVSPEDIAKIILAYI